MPISSIYHNVPVIRQPKSQVCWFTCMQMVTRYCRMVGKSPRLVDPADDRVLAGLYQMNWVIPWVDSERHAKRVGYDTAAISPNLDGLYKMLLQGPLIYGGKWNDTEGHWVVITGMSGDQLSVNDPAVGRLMPKWTDFLGGTLSQHADEPLYYAR